MARTINSADQQNLWARSSEDSSGFLEPQRSDLFVVDFKAVVKAISARQETPFRAWYPQYAQSITFPEHKIRAEAFRRDSVPFNMPTWDEPLDAMKVVFLLPAVESENPSHPVLDLLEIWLGLVRGGLGSRAYLYSQPNALVRSDVGWFPLNGAPNTVDGKSYRADAAFDFSVKLLRGGDTQDMLAAMRLDRQPYYDALWHGATGSPTVSTLDKGYPRSNFALVAESMAGVTAQMTVSTEFAIKRAWLGGYRINELSYARSEILTCEATFYPEAIYRI